jgi:choline-sulfatase
MSNDLNILLLLSDEHSFRFLSARESRRGGEPCHTPTLDRLIDQGANCDAAYCQMPLCTPSRMSMLTGRHSHRCGAWGNGSVLSPDLPTMGSHLGRHGYATATVGKMHLGGSLQHAGFGARPYGDFGGPPGHQLDPLDRMADRQGEPGMAMRSRTLDAGVSQIPESLLQEQMVARESLAWLRQHRHRQPDTPWMLMASFSRPHFPLTAPRRFFDRYYPAGVTPPRVARHSSDSADHPMTESAIRGFRTDEIGDQEMLRARAAYFACVDTLDEIIGDFLALLERDGLLDNTLIVYTSDHGELAGEHGLFWKNTWHEAATRVPLIFSLPEHRSGELAATEIAQPVSLADLFPTLCGLSQVPLPPEMDGLDLADAVRGRGCLPLAERPGVICESLSPRWGKGTEFRMIRTADCKYIAFRGCEDLAFDLQADPDELVNLVARATTAAEVSRLDSLRASVLDGFDFDRAEVMRLDSKRLAERFPARVRPRHPNQILRGDGLLVEADSPLYSPDVVSSDPGQDFDDYPG